MIRTNNLPLLSITQFFVLYLAANYNQKTVGQIDSTLHV